MCFGLGLDWGLILCLRKAVLVVAAWMRLLRLFDMVGVCYKLTVVGGVLGWLLPAGCLLVLVGG